MALQNYVGHGVEDIAARYGPPTQRLTLPNGATAFRWVFAANGAPAAQYAPEMFVPVSIAQPAARSHANTVGLLRGGMCVYTVLATWNDGKRRWLVTGYEPPRIDCD